MRKLSLFALAAVAFLGITGSANAATPMLETGISIATTVFFFERNTVAASWRTSISSWTSYWCCVHSLYVHEGFG